MISSSDSGITLSSCSEQQARFDERLESMHARFEERFNKLEDVQAQQAENINGLLEAVAALTATS